MTHNFVALRMVYRSICTIINEGFNVVAHWLVGIGISDDPW